MVCTTDCGDFWGLFTIGFTYSHTLPVVASWCCRVTQEIECFIFPRHTSPCMLNPSKSTRWRNLVAKPPLHGWPAIGILNHFSRASGVLPGRISLGGFLLVVDHSWPTHQSSPTTQWPLCQTQRECIGQNSQRFHNLFMYLHHIAIISPSKNPHFEWSFLIFPSNSTIKFPVCEVLSSTRQPILPPGLELWALPEVFHIRGKGAQFSCQPWIFLNP